MDYAPIIITFNGTFIRNSKESQKNAIMRHIAQKLINQKHISNNQLKFIVDEEKLIEHIIATSGGKPVVLLIDELNKLSENEPIDKEAATFLKTYFLDQKNAYLVFSTHLLMNID
jgi:hypothetical protein